MTQPNKTQIIAEKVKAFAYGFFGSLFFTLGLTYFSEKEYYRVPRILRPVYELFGSLGLAIALLIVGAGLMFFAYKRFTKFGGKAIIMLVTLPLMVGAAYGINKLTEKTYQPDFMNNKHKQEKTQVVKEIKNAERPNISNQKANDYLDNLEELLVKMKHAKEQNDSKTFDVLDKEYLQLGEKMSKLVPEMSKTDQYRDFVIYNAHLSQAINSLREI